MAKLEQLDGETWEPFLQSDLAVLMLGKSDCAACNAWTQELEAFLDSDGDRYEGVRFGKIVLDQRGLTSFKRAHGPLLASATNLPYTIIFKGGEQQKAWFGGGASRLENRLARVTA
ncbi:MAG: hypothetical protein EP329_06420 [Deltaproteobacteria bacterium]|nr:MAG: hypothetical protein EP329_06420 [Deltaproteobacteria bacterium]